MTSILFRHTPKIDFPVEKSEGICCHWQTRLVFLLIPPIKHQMEFQYKRQKLMRAQSIIAGVYGVGLVNIRKETIIPAL